MSLPPPAIHAQANVVDIARLLAAIAEVESGDDPNARGWAGERSVYQLTEAVWREETHLPFSRAFNPTDADAVARKHIFTLISRLRERHIPVTAFNLARLWNPSGGEGYARRVCNLFEPL
jgi:hypothetical protein